MRATQRAKEDTTVPIEPQWVTVRRLIVESEARLNEARQLATARAQAAGRPNWTVAEAAHIGTLTRNLGDLRRMADVTVPAERGRRRRPRPAAGPGPRRMALIVGAVQPDTDGRHGITLVSSGPGNVTTLTPRDARRLRPHAMGEPGPREVTALRTSSTEHPYSGRHSVEGGARRWRSALADRARMQDDLERVEKRRLHYKLMVKRGSATQRWEARAKIVDMERHRDALLTDLTRIDAVIPLTVRLAADDKRERRRLRQLPAGCSVRFIASGGLPS